jgi:hypothetical protein
MFGITAALYGEITLKNGRPDAVYGAGNVVQDPCATNGTGAASAARRSQRRLP